MNVDIGSSAMNREGFLKIWRSNPITGESSLLVDKKNTILYPGSDLLADLLGGKTDRQISHLYLGYSNDDNDPANDYTINKTFSALATNGVKGYLRIPLTFPATFTKDTSNNYVNNIVVFTIQVNNASTFRVSTGAALDGTCKFFEAALVAATAPNATVDAASHQPTDKVFARVAFERITYDANFNLTISWGVKFTS